MADEIAAGSAPSLQPSEVHSGLGCWQQGRYDCGSLPTHATTSFLRYRAGRQDARQLARVGLDGSDGSEAFCGNMCAQDQSDNTLPFLHSMCFQVFSIFSVPVLNFTMLGQQLTTKSARVWQLPFINIWQLIGLF